MTTTLETPYDYISKGASDYAAGKRDERLYNDAESEHGRKYRTGWQNARRADPNSPDPSGSSEKPDFSPSKAWEPERVSPPSTLRERASKGPKTACKQPPAEQLGLF